MDPETQHRIANVKLVQSLIDNIDQCAYISGNIHEDDTAGQLRFALLRFAYRYELLHNGGRLTHKLATSMKDDLEAWGITGEEVTDLVEWECITYDEGTQEIVSGIKTGCAPRYPDSDDDEQAEADYDNDE